MNGAMKKKSILQLSVIAISLLVVQLAYSDTLLNFTDESEHIYFGSFDTGFRGIHQLAVCCVIGDGVPEITYYPLESGKLFIYGKGGDDHIEAIHNDTKHGVAFGDINLLTYSQICLSGDRGNDTLIGTIINRPSTKDILIGGDGDDVLKGMDGNDSLFGQEGDDDIDGGLGDDYIHGGPGVDYLMGHRGNDEIYGGDGDDFIRGARENDVLYGQEGNDYLIGDQDNDRIDGGDGDDVIIGGTGIDVMDGGPGKDTCWGRRVKNPTVYDPDDPVDPDNHHETDWNDIARSASIENQIIRDPYREWVYLTEHRNHTTFDQLTTSNPDLLFQDYAAGASLLSSVGDFPLALDSNNDRYVDDVAVYRPSSACWYYDAYHNGSTDERFGPWGLRGDRAVAGDFDGDGRCDDVAVFRPTMRRWYYDFNHNKTTDATRDPWALAGDLPISGDFDRDGIRDDVAVFRPADRIWYFDHNHDGSTDDKAGPWGNRGDIPLAGDFDRDGFVDDVAVFRPSNRQWYFDYDHDGTTDEQRGPWAIAEDMPLAGDFDRDRYCDDVAVFRPSTGMWYYSYGHEGSTSRVYGPWGSGGEMLHATHKQYPSSCGYSSLNIVMEQLERTDPRSRVFYPRDLDLPAVPTTGGSWDPNAMVDVGYHLSTEHIIYENFHHKRQEDPSFVDKVPAFMDADGRLNTNDARPISGGRIRDASYYEIQYNIGNVNWLPSIPLSQGNVQMWAENCSGVGFTNLEYIANKFCGPVCDAKFVDMSYGRGQKLVSFAHLKDVIESFIDNNIPLLINIEDGHHYNALMGYWDLGKDFYIYTADPLDGWGRPFYLRPMRWRKIKVNSDSLPGGSKALGAVMVYGHSRGDLDGPGWARDIDSRYETDVLCGHLRLNIQKTFSSAPLQIKSQ